MSEVVEFDASLEIAASVTRTPSGHYEVHIEDLNGAVEIPYEVLEAIWTYASGYVAKDKSASS